MTDPAPSEELTEFQIRVAQLFFALPASQGFLLAGGAALLAQHLTARPTQDLDFFTRDAAGVPTARDALEAAVRALGWSVVRIHDTDTFCRLVLTGDEALLVDLALDSPPQLPPTVSFLGPTFAPEELAARKVLAIFDRAEARDFADVYALSSSFDRELMLERAATLDLGFTTGLFADSLSGLDRFSDDEIPVAAENVAAVRAYFLMWQNQLRASA